ncbi:hypothetical protein S40285_08672 [Stachybotrys chlorohalonatus IBT 40285]|uniref:ADP-ribosylation factor GTPase-activating protein n=1 Tax=Stachybotrys chlorohalonatus (strain IBT 40285) TaxID=1283841 RepID=A0A084Q9F0_STAC4|nr:hypothetical protein S40285_08672 [Stachybotrys chlorohalonata IBT 40285]
MGNVGSRPEEGPSLYLRDQNRLTLSALSITQPRKRTTINIVPNAFPASRISASRSLGDNGVVEFVQDFESTVAGAPSNFLLKLSNDDELVLTFTFIIRRPSTVQSLPPNAATNDPQPVPADTNISGLTFVYASSPREVENLVTREFHADPNLHKNSNVALVGDYSTSGFPSATFEWTWKWKPPKAQEDRGGGWKNSCSFVEYDPRAHRLHTLASFSFWVANVSPPMSHPSSPSPPFLLASPPKLRVPSSQSVDSRLTELDEPLSPTLIANEPMTPGLPGQSRDQIKVDVPCLKPRDDAAVGEDGPVFRATLKALEQKTGNMRTQMKKVLKKAEQAHASQLEANDAWSGFMEALRETASTHANAVQPALEHYFDNIAREILLYQKQNTANLQKIIIDPVNKLYQLEIKQAESKKRDFDEESKDYYAYVSRYLGQRQDSAKAKKLAESDSKYQNKRRNFELKRFDYSSFVQDLHGGRKEQEVLSHLTKFADSQTRGFLTAAKRIENLLPQLEALSTEVLEADKEYQYQRLEREEKRRLLEKSNVPYVEPEQASTNSSAPIMSSANGNANTSDSELGRADSTGSQLKTAHSGGSGAGIAALPSDLSRSPGSLGQPSINSPAHGSKFKGIRDLEERDPQQSTATQRKEGLLWALNRPGGHVDPRSLNKPGWHKFWIVLDQGKLSEYSNWKQKLDLHMDPIDLRMASVREARNAERRFCFEVITPSFKRVYQATSEEDMNNWIVSINNALQSAMEGRAYQEKPSSAKGTADNSMGRDIGSILTGKTHSLGHSAPHPYQSQSSSGSGLPMRRITVGARPNAVRTSSSGYDENPDRLLQMVRDTDQGNCWCADCGSGSKVEWVSINLGIILCIECSGIHRSLGTHISKVRSLTLDIKSFTIDIVEVMLLIGNRVSNMVWEARLDASLKPGPQSSREQRLRFITAKYVDRAFVEPISSTLSRYGTSEETLLAAIKKNEIQQVLYALALKANPNAVDKMRGTHSIWLALAAADPASPSGGQAGPGAGTSEQQDGKAVPFPIAELLIQNGAEIPASLPAFPLGRFAQLYVEQKRGRSIGSSDAVPSLPSSTNSSERLQREKESRLHKRVSAGGRLAKSPIPEK